MPRLARRGMMRRIIRTSLLLAAGCGLPLALAGPRTTADAPARGSEALAAELEARFRQTVRPFLETYCLACHGKEKPKGELDLSAFTTAESVARDLPRWEVVLEQ